jgi:Brp/Blh family beta-carotene 15,15'-monooxygenase
MVKVLQIQGLAFSITALVVSALSVGIGRLNEQTELIVLGVLILLLGVPHGALDTIFAHRLYGISSPLGWAGFVALYLLLAAGVVALWVMAPAGFLLGFLVISAAHFSGDPAEGTPLPVRILQGGCVLILPALLHEGEMGRLFALLAGQNAADTITLQVEVGGVVFSGAVAVAAAAATRCFFDTCLTARAAAMGHIAKADEEPSVLRVLRDVAITREAPNYRQDG